jgi:hypothetical protein
MTDRATSSSPLPTIVAHVVRSLADGGFHEASLSFTIWDFRSANQSEPQSGTGIVLF